MTVLGIQTGQMAAPAHLGDRIGRVMTAEDTRVMRDRGSLFRWSTETTEMPPSTIPVIRAPEVVVDLCQPMVPDRSMPENRTDALMTALHRVQGCNPRSLRELILDKSTL